MIGPGDLPGCSQPESWIVCSIVSTCCCSCCTTRPVRSRLARAGRPVELDLLEHVESGARTSSRYERAARGSSSSSEGRSSRSWANVVRVVASGWMGGAPPSRRDPQLLEVADVREVPDERGHERRHLLGQLVVGERLEQRRRPRLRGLQLGDDALLHLACHLGGSGHEVGSLDSRWVSEILVVCPQARDERPARSALHRVRLAGRTSTSSTPIHASCSTSSPGCSPTASSGRKTGRRCSPLSLPSAAACRGRAPMPSPVPAQADLARDLQQRAGADSTPGFAVLDGTPPFPPPWW